MLADFPKSLAALKAIQPQIQAIGMDHRGAISALNVVRQKAGLPVLSVNDLIMATIPRLEDKLNETQASARPESEDEQEAEED